MKKTICAGVILFITFNSFAQPILILQKEIVFGGQRDRIISAVKNQGNDGFFLSGVKLLLNGSTPLTFSKVIKYDSSISPIWKYTGTERTSASSIALTSDGIFVGQSWDTASVVKIDNSGQVVWKKNYGTNCSPILATNENVLVILLSNHSTSQVIICDLDGNQINSWGLQIDLSYGMMLHENNLYIFADNLGGEIHSKIIKNDLSGNIIWQDTLMAVQGLRGDIDKNGNLYVSGHHYNGQSCYRTVKYDLDGNRIWEKLYHGDFTASYNLSNIVHSVVAHPDGGCVVSGTLVKIGGNDPNALDGGVISYNPDGEINFKIRYDANPGWYQTGFTASLFCPDQGLAIFGSTIENLNLGTPGMLFMTKWDGVTDVEPEPISIPSTFSLSQNYPNPFNPLTTINYEIAVTSPVTLKVYDILGEEVAFLVNEEKSIGNYEVEFNATELPSGIYFYRVKAGNFIETKKMILLK